MTNVDQVIHQWMRLVEALFPSSVNVVNIGKSYEGRDILGLRVSMPGPPGASPPKKAMVIAGALHAREWISTTTVVCFPAVSRCFDGGNRRCLSGS